MLHILLLILKIIGIILAIIVGLLVAIVCIVLFVPVRYVADGICKGNLDTLKAKGTVTWLFHLLCADVYFKEQKLMWKVRIAFITKTGGRKYATEPKEDASDEKEKDVQKSEKKLSAKEQQEAQKKPDTEKSEKSNTEEKIQKAAIPAKDTIAKAQKADESLETESKADQTVMQKDVEPGQSDRGRNKRKSGAFFEKIRTIYEKIKCTIKKICDTLKSLSGKTEELSDKKDKIADFIQDESHVNALQKAKKEAGRMLKALRPGKLDAKVIVGFEDPQHTGQLLAVLSVLYPFIEGNLEVTPDFEQKVLKGKLHVKGHLRVCHFVAIAIRLLLSKEIRQTYRDAKDFQLS